MAEDRNQFKSIYGDAEDEFEIEDVSDETLSIPTEEIRAAREAEIEEEAEEAEAEVVHPHPADKAPVQHAARTAEQRPAPAKAAAPRPAAPADGKPVPAKAEPAAPAVDEEPFLDEEIDGVTFDDEERAPEPHRAPVHEHRPEPERRPRYEDDDDRRDHYYDDYDSRDRYEVDGDPEEDEEPEAEPVSILSYVGHAILFTIPIIGTILMLVYIISDKRNAHLRHFAQIWLVTLLVIAIGASAAVYLLGLG